LFHQQAGTNHFAPLLLASAQTVTLQGHCHFVKQLLTDVGADANIRSPPLLAAT
jgi:hypothetical protein